MIRNCINLYRKNTFCRILNYAKTHETKSQINLHDNLKAQPCRLYSVKNIQDDKSSLQSDIKLKEPVTIHSDEDRKLKILKLEVSVLRQEGRKVPDPDLMKAPEWEELLKLGSKSARSRYYTFLWTNERKRENDEVSILRGSFKLYIICDMCLRPRSK